MKKIISLGFSLSVRGIGAAVGILHAIIVARHLKPEQSGMYFLAYTLIITLSTISGLGLNTLSLKKFSTEKNEKLLTAHLYQSTKIIIFASSAICFILYSTSTQIGRIIGHKEIVTLLPEIGFGLASLALLNLTCSALQGLQKTKSMVFFQNILPFLGVIILTVFANFNNFTLSVNLLAKTLSANIFLSLTTSFIYLLWLINNPGNTIKIEIEKKEFVHFWVTQLSQLILFSGALAFYSRFITPAEISAMYIAQRLSAAITFILICSTLIISPKIAILYHGKELLKFKNLVVKSTRLIFLIGIPIITPCIIYSDEAMSFFGDEYKKYGFILLILSFGHLFVLLCGPTGAIMTMTGMEASMAKMNMAISVPALIAGGFLSYYYSTMGIALYLTILLIIQNGAAAILIRKKFHFFPITG